MDLNTVLQTRYMVLKLLNVPLKKTRHKKAEVYMEEQHQNVPSSTTR